MAALSAREAVARVDTAWLHMDEAANLMVVTLVLMFDRPLDYQRFRYLLESRLLKVPRFRQRIVPSSGFLSFAAPRWEEDPHFDLDQHFEQAPLDDAADDAALHRVVSSVMSRPLDSSRPLWHFYFVPQYKTGSAIVARIHHCIGDGLGLMHVFMSMSDDPQSLSVSTACAGRPAAIVRAVAGGAMTAARLLLMSGDRLTNLKGPLTVDKRASWSTPVPLDYVKTVSRTTGASVNDVLLTAVTGALRRYLLSRSPVAEDWNLRGVVPVNLRRPEEAHLLGNRFGLVFVPMPVGLADPAERLAELCRRMRAIKGSLEPMVTFQILRALGIAPRQLFDLVVWFFGRKATAVVTNVIGPREAVTYGGVRLSEVMFWVPCAGRLGLGISILSYAGRVSVGFATDAGLVPDPETMVNGFDCELAQLLAYAGTRQDLAFQAVGVES